jgi:coatomer subunit beta
MLIQAIHACAVKYPSVASNVVLALMDFLGDANIPTAVEVVTFVREVAETYPELRESILRKLFLSLKHITASSVRPPLNYLKYFDNNNNDGDYCYYYIAKQ